MIKSSSLICTFFICMQLNNMAFAEKLSQADYDQFIADAQSQRQAFCQRLTAYEEIQKVSEENHELNMASTMAMIAKSFLDRQAQSMNNSGMTTAVFCKSREV